MDVSVTGTIDQKTYLENLGGTSAPLSPLDPPMRWRPSSTVGWYSRVTKVGTKGLIYGFVKQTQYCVSFIAP